MNSAKVLRNRELVGILSKEGPKSYVFKYESDWFQSYDKPAVSLTLPKTQQEYRSEHLFPFFFNMLSEGANLQLQARQNQVDENDFFSLLLLTANSDTIGAITIEPISN